MVYRPLPFFSVLFLLTCSDLTRLSAQTFAASGSSHIFIENKGQVTDQSGAGRNDIDFKVPAQAGLNIFIGAGQLHYQWAKPEAAKNVVPVAGEEQSPAPAALGGVNTEMYRMDVSLVGANPDAIVTKEELSAYSERYYLPSAGDGAIARTFRRIIYHNVYPNIDWVFTLMLQANWNMILLSGQEEKHPISGSGTMVQRS